MNLGWEILGVLEWIDGDKTLTINIELSLMLK